MIECPLSYLIQGKINNTIINSPKDAFEATGNNVRFYYPLIGLTGAGLICDNRNHTEYNKGQKQQCANYSVRFCCPGGKLIFLHIKLSFHRILYAWPYSYILLIYLHVQTEVSNSLNFANSETITEPTITKLTSTSITSSITVTNDTTSTDSNKEDTESSNAPNY